MSARVVVTTGLPLTGEQEEWLAWVALARGYRGWAHGTGRRLVLQALLREAMKRLPLEAARTRAIAGRHQAAA